MFAFEAASAYECLQNMDYSLLDTKRFRNARHKCALKSCTDLKSRNMIALSNIVCVYDEGKSKI